MSEPSLGRILKNMELFSRIESASIRSLESLGAVKYLDKGEHVFHDKDQAPFIYVVSSGMVSLYKLSSHGEKKVIFVLGPGSVINDSLDENLPASANCECLENAAILCFGKKPFLDVMKNDFELTKAMVGTLSGKVRRLYRQLKNTTGSVRGDRRIAAKLWKLARDYGVPTEEGTRIDIRLTVTSLAEMVGTKRETVSRQLKMLTDLNLIASINGRFVIPDREKLVEYFKAP